jgi:hypothetical protein
MGEKIVVGPVNKGLTTNRTAFNIDDDAFPVLLNAYQWRGRIKRKRGSSFLGRLERYFNSANSSYGSITSINVVDGGANLLYDFGLVSGNIVPTSVSFVSGSNTYTDPAGTGVLVGTPAGTGTIDYESGGVSITSGGGTITTATFLYYPCLPVMGIDDEILESNDFPTNLAFDTIYSYQIDPVYNRNNNNSYAIYDVSFYKNPASIGSYTAKGTPTPVRWNGQNYQQFWTVNYQGAIFATNGINVPFTTANKGMQYAQNSQITYTSNTATTLSLTITNCPLVIGDFVFANEWGASTAANAATLNFQSGYVTSASGMYASKSITITFPEASLATDTFVPGIIQYLTNSSNPSNDCIRYYDGDPTNGSATNPVLDNVYGWVNFCPPLSQFQYSIAGLPQAQYYLIGARTIVPYKDRLLFFGPVVQTSAGVVNYLQDTVIYSQNGTAYYNASFQGNPVAATTQFYASYIVPNNQTATASAYFEDQIGFGGYISAGVDQAINTTYATRDVIIVGLENQQSRLIYTGNDVLPFLFYTINSEYGSGAPQSGIQMDEGVVSYGPKGFIITNEDSCQRIDLAIPDQVFEINLNDNGTERICAQRDFINEWIYFTYRGNESTAVFPNQTLLWNYRDNSWATFDESFTAYGTFRPSTMTFTWATIGTQFNTWNQWNEPWNAGASTLLQPQVVAGNQQGFIVIRNQGTTEPTTLNINFSVTVTITGVTKSAPSVEATVVTGANQFVPGQQVTFSGVVGMIQLNGNTYTVISSSPTTFTIKVDSSGFTDYSSGGLATPVEPIFSQDHGLNNGDYFVLNNCTGTMAVYNGQVFSVSNAIENGFVMNPMITIGTYFGLGTITRLYRPQIMSKQFPVAWAMARKTRLGPQQYLLTTTPAGQITVLIFLSQNDEFPYNIDNNATIYSATVYTCPESINLGLTPTFVPNMSDPKNTNLNMVTAQQQQQTWHRLNTSLLGDTVQIGFTLSDAQMYDPTLTYQFSEIELHGLILDCSPSMLLA